MYAYLIVINGIGSVKKTCTDLIVSLALVNNMEQLINSLWINSIFIILQTLIVWLSYSYNTFFKADCQQWTIKQTSLYTINAYNWRTTFFHETNIVQPEYTCLLFFSQTYGNKEKMNALNRALKPVSTPYSLIVK